MRKLFAIVVIYLIKKLGLYSLYCLKVDSYLVKAGWFRSFASGLPIDGCDEPLPWMTYPAISFLEKRVKMDMHVFEYGSGNSTLWWAKRVKHLVCCEHDRAWYTKMVGLIPPNVTLFQIDLEYGGAYSRKVVEYARFFDIIIIDGRDRNNCAKNCLGALKDGGVIVWDNSDRDSYEAGYEYLFQNGYKRLDFEGMGPVNAYAWCTSVFYRSDNCLGI